MNIVDFVKQYATLIVAGLSLLVSIIWLFIKKKPLINLYDESFYKDLVVLIKEAEEKFIGPKLGTQRRNYVISRFFSKHHYAQDDMKFITSFVLIPAIEQLLELPSKKGETDEKKNEE